MVYTRPSWPKRPPREPGPTHDPRPPSPTFEYSEQGAISRRAANLAPSLIRDIADSGIGQADIIPLWFGEGCWPSPDVAVEAARRALAGGDHFYQPNSGKPELREELSAYHRRIYGVEIDPRRITVTASGMQALALVAQVLVDPGDRAVVVGPVWPNIRETLRISGAFVVEHALRPAGGRWSLDVERLTDDIGDNTRLVFINSPANPTGWTATPEELDAIIEHCRRHKVWLVADDAYSRLCYGHRYAPCALTRTEPDDLVISVNTFSKAWSMTGWRLGWMIAPADLEAPLAMLTEFNIAGAPGFVQAAGIAALRDGEPDVALLQQRLDALRPLVGEHLMGIAGLRYLEPEGAFYSFFGVDGMTDSVAAAKHILATCGVGLAPGRAFGPHGEGHLRLCFAQPPETLTTALERLADYFSNTAGIH
ncbi:MAG: pyridoxal phosphate-dependent aminotransferase [bacterium]|nr:pyridoxal phosphate-dependent aminotransferase [bacterium]